MPAVKEHREERDRRKAEAELEEGSRFRQVRMVLSPKFNFFDAPTLHVQWPWSSIVILYTV